MRQHLCIVSFLLMQLSFSVFASEQVTVIPEVKVVKADNQGRKGFNSRPQQTILTKQAIKESPTVTLPMLLQQEQSTVRLTNNSGDSSQTVLSLRGFGDNAVANALILVDGFPLINASLLAPNLNAINLADVERIDIIPGSQAVLWGDQAVGGVVNITTRHPKAWAASLVGGVGDFNLRTGYGLISNHFKNGFYFKSNVLGYTNDQYRHHNKQRDGQLSVLLGYDYANGLLQFSVNRIDHTIQFPGGLTKAQYHKNPSEATNFKNASNYHTNIFQLLSQHAFNDDWMLETRIAQQQINADGFIFTEFDLSERETLFHPRLIGKWRDNKIIFGYQALTSNYQLASQITKAKSSQGQQDIYSQLIIPLSSKINMTAGARGAWQVSDADSNQQMSNYSRHVLVSEWGVTYRPSLPWQFYLRRQGNFRFPKANEVLWTPTLSTVLEPQAGVSYETGAVWQHQKHQVQFNLYDLRLHDEIAFNPTETTDQPFGSFTNLDPTERRGFSISEIYYWNEKNTLDGQLNYVQPIFLSGPYAGKQIPAVPRITANASWRYRLSDYWRFRYNLLYTGKRYPSEDLTNSGQELSGYWLHGIALQYINKALELSFSIENLFNQMYSTYTLFNTYNQTNTYYPGTGRSYLLTLKWNVA